MKNLLLFLLLTSPVLADDVCTMSQAVSALKPGAQWVLNGTTCKDLSWMDKSQTKPTQKQINAWIVNCHTQTETAALLRSHAKDVLKNSDATDKQKLDALVTLENE